MVKNNLKIILENNPKHRVIAEIGINHKGSIKEAKKLIDDAAKANCWGVKFQYRNLKTFYSKSNEIGDGIIIEELRRINLTLKQFKSLAVYAREKKIKVGVSFFRIEDAIHFSKIFKYYDFFKIPSAECKNVSLLRFLLKTKKIVMISTGGHTHKEILEVLGSFKDNNLVIFHCIANYPATLGTQQLLSINKLKEMGFKEVGYSSHDKDIEVCLLSIFMGATWIERHITSDKDASGLDHSSSSNFQDFVLLDRFLQKFKGILGNETKSLNQGEILNMQNLGTGLYLKKSITAGEKVKMHHLDIKAPRKGISPGDYQTAFKDKTITIDIKKGDPLEKRHFEPIKRFKVKDLTSFAKRNLVGIPVRTHDFLKFKRIIPTGVYEFHLSYQECLKNNLSKIIDKVDKSDYVSFHLPDYISENRIIDPISTDKKTKKESREIISNVIYIAQKIKEKINKRIPIVGSFSERNGKSRKETLDELFSYFENKQFDNVDLYPQWLPVNAWYFGGNATLDLFNSMEDIEYLKENKKKICLDVCHLSLSANFYRENWKEWLKELKPLIGHIHLADAIGNDGEGLPLGEGDIKDFREFLKIDCLKIIEVWQGHFNNGQEFLKALKTLKLGDKI